MSLTVLPVILVITMVTISISDVPVRWRGGTHFPGARESSAVEEDGQVDNVPHVVVSIDVGVSEDAVQVLVDGFDDDVGVAGEDGYEGAFGEQHPHLQKENYLFQFFTNVFIGLKPV